MRDYENEESYPYANDEIPQDEEFVPKKKIVIGKQLLLIIQLIICGFALLFMVVMKLIGTGFCQDILSWYETNYYDSIYTSNDGKNDLSIFGIGSSENKQSESSKTESNKDSSKGEKSDASNSKAESKSENGSSKNTST